MPDGLLTDVLIYPIKSCRRVAVDSVQITPLGLDGDRRWQVVNDAGQPITQRQHRILATVRPEPTPGGLLVSAPGANTVELADPGPTDTEVRSNFGVTLPAADGGPEAAAWFSELLSEECRIVGIGKGPGWRLPPELDMFGQSAAFADAAPVLVATTSSLAWLQERASDLFGMERFRPNLVVENDEPWVEDTWGEFRIGQAALKLGAPWPRCAIPQIDQDTAGRHKEPAKVLRKHRWCVSAPSVDEGLRSLLEGNALFGIGCSIGPEGSMIEVGDQVEVTVFADPVLATPV